MDDWHSIGGVLIGLGAAAAASFVAVAGWQLRKGATRLHRACTKGDLEFVKSGVTKQPGLVDRPDLLGLRPLQYAAESGRTEVVRFLLYEGASATTAAPWTALSMAAWNGHCETVAMLLAHLTEHHREHLNEIVVGQALCGAAAKNHVNVLKLFRDRGFSIDACHDGSTPLHVAAYEGHEPTVRWLLNHGADTCRKDKRGKQARAIAVAEGHEHIVKCFDEARLHA